MYSPATKAWLTAQALLVIAAALLALRWWRLLRSSPLNFDRGLPWAGLALLLLLLVVAIPWQAPRLSAQRVRDFFLVNRLEIAAVALILALSALFRLYWLGSFPHSPGTGFEETQTGGIAYRILHGMRPIEFAFTNYAAALGFALGGYNAGAMRIVFLALGIFSVLPLYFTLRMLTSVPAALFTTVLFTVCRWLALSSRFADELFFGCSLVILASFLLVLVIKRGDRLALLGLAILLGALSYEYTSYRHVPYLMVASLLVAFAPRAWRLAKGSRGPSALLPYIPLALAFVLGIFVVIAPLAAATARGDDIYFEGFHRNEDRPGDVVFFGLLPADWQDKVKHTALVFTPLAPAHPTIDTKPLTDQGHRWFDPVTATLAMVAIAYALLTLHRPYRLLFAVWLLAGLFAGGVVIKNFYVDRFTGLLPALFVLIALLVEDALNLARRLKLSQFAYAGLAPLAAIAFATNLLALDHQVHDRRLEGFFIDPLVNVCAFSKSLGRNTYAYVWAENQTTSAIFMTSDYDWACHDLLGEDFDPVGASWPQPLLPLQTAYVFLTRPPQRPDSFDAIRAVHPESTVVEYGKVGDFELYAVVVPPVEEPATSPSPIATPKAD